VQAPRIISAHPSPGLEERRQRHERGFRHRAPHALCLSSAVSGEWFGYPAEDGGMQVDVQVSRRA
jgi:hypothetical protein